MAQSAYTVIERGEEISVCIVLVSLTGQINEEGFSGITTLQGSALTFSVSGAVNFTGVAVNEPILCAPVIIERDNNFYGTPAVYCFCFIEGPPFITITPGRDQATIEVVETTGIYYH